MHARPRFLRVWLGIRIVRVDDLNAGLADPAIKARLFELGADPAPTTPAEFGAYLAAQTEKWAKLIKAAGIKPE